MTINPEYFDVSTETKLAVQFIAELSKKADEMFDDLVLSSFTVVDDILDADVID